MDKEAGFGMEGGQDSEISSQAWTITPPEGAMNMASHWRAIGGGKKKSPWFSLLGSFQARWRWSNVNTDTSTATVTEKLRRRSPHGWAAQGGVHVRLEGARNTDLQWDGGEREREGRGKTYSRCVEPAQDGYAHRRSRERMKSGLFTTP